VWCHLEVSPNLEEPRLSLLPSCTVLAPAQVHFGVRVLDGHVVLYGCKADVVMRSKRRERETTPPGQCGYEEKEERETDTDGNSVSTPLPGRQRVSVIQTGYTVGINSVSSFRSKTPR
jgi:hypothetical protein